ncbi:MAG: TetR/AcrR family transcriptional regulator [Ilumatobacteraceae bacterium]
MPTKKPAEKKAAPKRRSPISRAEGERRLIQAAKQLIREKPFSEVGVRDIALLADVNHGFVHTWFGGKNELLLAVVREQLLALAEAVPLAAPGTPAVNFFDPDVVSMVRLVLWLDLEGVKTGGLFANMPILEALTTRYVEIEKIDPSMARDAAIQAISIGLGASTFGPLLGMTEMDNIIPVMQLWRHIVGLLAEHPLP